ncbi:MAG: hypothetical protein JW776_07980 [Candidatus Lokiarchaeota archaeon]|nr:hypothetical protein [Candidatus Lokiarchaeota archaeon]
MSFSLGDHTLRLGYILGCTQRAIIVRPSTWSRDKKLPAIGSEIYDSNAMRIGKITDIIGPVYKPYFKIKSSRPNLSSSSFSSRVGEPLYTLPDSRGKKKGKITDWRMRDMRHQSNKNKSGKLPYKPRSKSSISRQEK